MAAQADGSIIVDTELNSEGFKAGSAELQRAVKSLGNSVNSLGPTFQKALSGSESAISSFNAKTAALENTIAELEAKMSTIGTKTVPTDQYAELIASMDQAGQKLEKLLAKQKELSAAGVSENSQQWRRLQVQIERTGAQCDQYNAKVQEMVSNGTAYQLGSQTEEYQRLSFALSEAKTKLAEMNTEANKSRGSFGSAVGKLVAGLKSAISHTTKLIDSNKKYKNTFNSILSSVSRIAPAAKLELIQTAM